MRKKLCEISTGTDIKYAGPLSEREFRILGWICLAFTQVSNLMSIGKTINPDLALRFGHFEAIIRIISVMALPFLLIANFATILNNADNHKKQILNNLIFMFLFGGLFLLVFYHHIIGFVAIFFSDSKNEALKAVQETLSSGSGSQYICFNIFVDLLLCSLVSFFLFHTPEKSFRKKWAHILFRIAAVLPILYEALTIYLKYLALRSKIVIPIWAFPLLPVKPPMTFVLFVVLALFEKIREHNFYRRGRSNEEYQLALQTNRNSLHFSVFASVSSLLAGLADLVIYFIFVASEIFKIGVDSFQADYFTTIILKLGFGNSISLIFFAPILLLFSYKRKPANKVFVSLIPVAGVALILLIYLQGAYQLLCQLPGFISSKLNLFYDVLTHFQ